MIGETIANYQIIEQIGMGGMATVYKAYQPSLDRYVAIKVLSTHLTGDSEFNERFQREAHSVARLEHPHILPVHDYGQIDNLSYIVMRFVEGGTLEEIIGKRISLSHITNLITQIAKALQYAHERGIVHRDVKPSNVLLDRGDWVFLTDFGVARMLDAPTRVTASGVGIGTPEYVSPEQGQGLSIDGRSDIYSLGIVLFELLTGRVPFEADTPVAVVWKHVNEPLPEPRSLNPQIPEAIEQVVLKAMAKSPDDRYQSADELASALNAATQDDQTGELVLDTTIGSSTRKMPKRDRVRKIVHRKRWPYLALATIFISIFTFFTIRWLTSLLSNVGISDPESVATEIGFVSGEPSPTLQPSQTIEPPTTEPTQTSTFVGPLGAIVYTCQVFSDIETNQICMMDPDGSNQIRLTSNNSVDHFYASWAPEGQSIVFSSNESGDYEIYELDFYGIQRQLTSIGGAYAPAISPDGEYIVFTNYDGTTPIVWIMNRDGSDPHPLIPNRQVTGWDPVWSPDGTHVLFASDMMRNIELYIVQADGSALRQLTQMTAMYAGERNIRGRSDWSPDGQFITYYAGSTWNWEIFIVDVDGENVQQLTDGGNNLAPSFSPDGLWITFTSYMDNDGLDHGCEIYTMRVDGSEIRRLTNNAYCDWQPRWGP